MARKKTVERLDYGTINDAAEMPNLLDIQLESYNVFLQADTPPEKRVDQGLQQIFNEVFPITDINENFSLEFVNYQLGTPRYSIDECRDRNMTFAAPLKATLRLVTCR